VFLVTPPPHKCSINNFIINNNNNKQVPRWDLTKFNRVSTTLGSSMIRQVGAQSGLTYFTCECGQPFSTDLDSTRPGGLMASW
jgi:hypothetical protein